MGIWAWKTMQALKRGGIEVAGLAPTSWIPHWLGWNAGLKNWAAVPKHWRHEDIDVYYPKCAHYPHRLVTRWIYDPLAFADSAFIWSACRRNFEAVIEKERPDVLQANFAFPSGYLAMQVKRTWDIPYVFHERSPQRLAAAQRFAWRQNLYCRVVRNADAVITLNRKLVNEIEGLTGVRPVMIPAAADPGPAAPVNEEETGKPFFLSVGALNPRKGHAALIDAIARLRKDIPDIHGVIVGGGPQRQMLQKLIADNGLEPHVTLSGRIPHARVQDLMRRCRFFVLPSKDEAFGTVYAEAMAAAKPIIACRDEGIGDYAEDQKHGLWVEYGNAQSIAEAMQRLWDDDNLRHRMGNAGRELVLKTLSYDAIAKSIKSIYSRVVDAGKR